LSFDIAIVGGGPAGLSVAREISQKCDANVVVVEEHNEIGRPAVSSAFTFVETVNKYGLNKAVMRYYTKVGMYSFLGSRAIFELSAPKLAVLDFTKACREIFLRCEKSHIEILTGTKAIGLKNVDGKLTIDLAGENDYFIKCDLLVDASGTSFFSEKYVHFRIPRFYSQPYGYELENCNIKEYFLDELSFFIGRTIGTGGGWFYPLTKTRCRFGIAEITKTPTPPIKILRARYNFAKTNMRPFSEMIEGAKPCIKLAGTIPAEPMKNMISDNIMRVGDSAGHATPHMLEGVRPTIESATLCGGFAVEAYEKHDFSKEFLERYERAWHNRNKSLYLYLLSLAEVAFSWDDLIIEKSINFQANRKVDPELYAEGLKGHFNFPKSFIVPQLGLQQLKILTRFIYHNFAWLLE